MTRNICCIGANHSGVLPMAVMADFCPGLTITVVDKDQQRIDAWNRLSRQELPVYEPGLQDVMNRVNGINLHFSADIKTASRSADIVFLSMQDGESPDQKPFDSQDTFKRKCEAIERIMGATRGSALVVERSIKPLYSQGNSPKKRYFSVGSHSRIVFNPEFMARGSAIEDLQNPDRILVGGSCDQALAELVAIYANWVHPSRIITSRYWSAELAKLAANAFLAQRVTSINAIAELCEASGADLESVRRVIGTDHRIGAGFLQPGPGLGGHSMLHDIQALIYLSEYYGLIDVARYWRGMLGLNAWSQQRIVRKIVQILGGTACNKRLAILGFAFKAETSDSSESPAIGICRQLLAAGAQLRIHDPQVPVASIQCLLEQALDRSQPGAGQFETAADVASVCEGADALVILTDWPAYRSLDWAELVARMQRPGWLVDTRCIGDLAEARAQGLQIWQIGQIGPC